MKKNLSIFILFLAVSGCCSSKKSSQSVTTEQQGISGFVYSASGNRMPTVDQPAPKPQPIVTTVFIYDSTNASDVIRQGYSAFYSQIKTKLITTVQSDSTGHFTVELPIGAYSLFTKVNGVFYANMFDEKNNIALVRVAANKQTTVQIKVDAGATY